MLEQQGNHRTYVSMYLNAALTPISLLTWLPSWHYLFAKYRYHIMPVTDDAKSFWEGWLVKSCWRVMAQPIGHHLRRFFLGQSAFLSACLPPCLSSFLFVQIYLLTAVGLNLLSDSLAGAAILLFLCLPIYPCHGDRSPKRHNHICLTSDNQRC